MFEKIKNIDLFSTNTYAIVSIVFDDVIKYNVLTVSKKKEQIILEKQFSTVDFNKIEKEIKTGTPLLLNFSGKGIISKKIEAKGNFLKEVLFGANVEDFYTYTLFEDKINFVSVCRKEVIDKQFSVFKEKSYKIIDFSIGPFVSSLSIKMISVSTLNLETHQLEFEDEKLVDFNSNTELAINYKLGDETLKSFSVLNFSTFLNYLYPSPKIDYDNQFLVGNIKEQKLKKAFDFFAVGTLVFFLLALLGSYFLMGHYNDRYVAIEKELYHFNDSYTQIKKMEKDLENKKFIVQNSGILNKRFLSFYTKKIIDSIPDAIILKSLKINPSIKKIKDEEEIKLDANTIIIEGETSNSFYANKWVKDLKKDKWIDKIEILNLVKTDKNIDSFSLKITVL